MFSIKVSLFGKFNIACGEKTGHMIGPRQVQELLSYLLLFRHHPQPRELLRETLWSNQSSANSRKCLRQTLWRLQSGLIKLGTDSNELELRIDNDWIQINTSENFWLDVAEFEKVFDLVKGKKTREISIQDFKAMESAAALYQGDLLEGWYSDWCAFERERFQTMHLTVLDKLVQFCELHHEYEAGLSYGMEILRHDHAYERTHRQMMRLYVMTGNRTQALHQYKRCVMALRDELGVEPSERTKQLYEQIRLDSFRPRLVTEEKFTTQAKVRTPSGLRDALHRLEEVSQALKGLEHKIQEEIAVLGAVVSEQN